MTKTIYTRIITKEITSVELKSVLDRELYIYSHGEWTNVLDEFSFNFTPEQFCQYIANYKAWAEHNNTWLDIAEGKAEFRSSINAAKDLLKDWLENNEFDDFKGLSAKQKEAVILVLISVKKQKHKANLLIPVIGDDYEYTINLFTGEVVSFEKF